MHHCADRAAPDPILGLDDRRLRLGDFERLEDLEPAPRLRPGESGGLGRNDDVLPPHGWTFVWL